MAGTIDRRDLIDGLAKGLRVIEAFDDDHPRLSASETARLADLSRTAARRYLLSLVHSGYAGTDGKQFWLLPRVLRLGHSYLGAARLPRLVQPFIQGVSIASGEAVSVSVLDGHDVVYVARSASPRVAGYVAGARFPAHVVSPGATILSTFDDGGLDRWIAEHDFASHSAHTVIDPARFREQVLQVRAHGYCLAEQQLDAGLRGIAVALRDRHGSCVGAVGMTLPLQPLTREQTVVKMLPLLQDAAQSLRPLL